MKLQIALSAAAILLFANGAEAASFALAKNSGPSRPHVAAMNFAGNGGPTKDTCTSSDAWGLCDLDDFEARCDAAGGGLVSLPGGGVDCDTSSWDED